jgi:hypothetical protein
LISIPLQNRKNSPRVAHYKKKWGRGKKRGEGKRKKWPIEIPSVEEKKSFFEGEKILSSKKKKKIFLLVVIKKSLTDQKNSSKKNSMASEWIFYSRKERDKKNFCLGFFFSGREIFASCL